MELPVIIILLFVSTFTWAFHAAMIGKKDEKQMKK